MLRETVRSLARELLPPVLVRAVRPFRRVEQYGHHGDYPSFAEALAACGTAGGAEPNVVETVASWTRVIRDRARGGRAIPLDDRSLQNLSALLLAMPGAAREEVRILDFGGALGGLYYQLREFIPRGRRLSWVVCETPIMAEAGTREFATDELTFVGSLEEAKRSKRDVIIASGSLQCVEDPPATLGTLASMADSLIINRIPLFDSPRDRLTLHNVNPSIYSARVPNWFFSESRWLARCRELGFEVVVRWDVPQDSMNLDGRIIVFSGMLLQAKNARTSPATRSTMGSVSSG